MAVEDTPPANLVTDGAISGLTDGTGISRLLGSKVIKDLVLDFCLTIVPALGVINVMNLNAALAVPTAVGIAALDSAARVIFRAVIRWAQTPAPGV